MDVQLLTIGLTFIIAAAIVFLIAYLAGKSWTISSSDQEENFEKTSNFSKKQPKTSVSSKTKNGVVGGGKKEKPGHYSHPWLASSLKGHSGRVLDLDFSSNGKYLVSCGEDRTLMLWHTKNLEEKEHKAIRGNVDLDHAKFVRFAPDSKSLIVCLSFANKLTIYKLAKKEEPGTHGVKIQHVDSVHYPEEHKQEIISIGIASNGRFIMSASRDNCLIVWDLRGSVLKTLDTKQSNIHYAAVSTCGRFIASAGFTPDVKVYEVVFSRTGEFQDVIRAFELKGHNSGIYSFDFNQDSTRMISASKDGTWNLYDTDIRYKLGQEPYLLRTGSWDLLKTADPASTFARISPNGDSFAIAAANHLQVYRSVGTEAEIRIENIHQEPISGLKFSLENKFLVTCGDKHVRVFHNIAGYRAVVENLTEQIKKAHGEAHKQRLKEQVEEARKFVSKILGTVH